MDESVNKQIENQNKISAMVKERQIQISELKLYFDYKNKKLYKDIICISANLQYFEELFNNKSEFRMRVENLLSLGLSMGKILDLNNPIKTIILGLKIFDEHETYLKSNSNMNN